MMKFQVVSDSSCDLGLDRLRQLGVDMVSYYVALGDEVYYREERDISTHDFYQKMADNPGVFPKTSMPTLEDYLALCGEGDNVVRYPGSTLELTKDTPAQTAVLTYRP